MKKENREFKLTTPVLFLVFNRLDTTKKVFEEIRKAKPKKLFVAADGPRNEKEKIKTEAVRKYILGNVDWSCKVKTLFREKNLGCKCAVSSAITWYFENVEQGIILEDDCLPSQSFFRFCQEMLEKYKDDERIMQISGTNVEGVSKTEENYFFARAFNAWGWATWRRAWSKYDLEMKEFLKIKKNKKIKYENVPFRGFKGRRLYKLLKLNKIDTWDYQWIYSCLINSSKCVVPKVNLVENLGLSGGTHTNNSDYPTIKRYEIKDFSKDDPLILNNKTYQKNYNKFFKRGILKRFFRRLVR